MREKPCELLEKGRVVRGPLASKTEMGNNGAFRVKCPAYGRTLHIIVSDGHGWEHVSVSYENQKLKRVPTWEELHWVKRLVWEDEECVMQLHPKQSQYVNCHPYTLHLWRPVEGEIPQPPSWMVGPRKVPWM